MPTARFFALALLAVTIPSLKAQDGEQLYTLYCSACHGVDGKGATGGAFPPLAGSDWIPGNPKRTIAIVLFGLEGPIEVSGKSYNLMMPPQGAALQDKQIQAILNYVHTAWGNKGEEIPGDLVRTVRSEFEERETAWTRRGTPKTLPVWKKKKPP